MIADVSERLLILAPRGRDATVAASILGEAGLTSDIVPNIGSLVTELEVGAGIAVVTEEGLTDADVRQLGAWIRSQPEWSDFPFVLVTPRGGGLERNPAAGRFLDLLGNVNFLERPFHPTTLVSLVQSALRGRRRQYDARTRLEDLRRLAEDLERRVEMRTADHAAAMAQLHEAQKLETLGQLTGGVAHDFNNLLTPITGALDLLLRQYGSADARANRLITNALQAADRARLLVQRLLGFARRQDLQAQPVDVAVLLNGMRDLIASSLGSTIELHIRHDPDTSCAMADPNQLELAILNLCVNARDAMPHGGPLTIVSEQVAIGPRSRPKLVPGLYVRVSVIDAGHGMDPDTLRHAVEPFYSTKEVGRGTGLGLSMVHGLAAQLGGGFWLSSEVGEGTRADLYLPIAENAAPAVAPARPQAATSSARSLRILLVDDEEIVRVATAEMIRELGHRVVDTRSALESLAVLKGDPHFDVLITDYKMPQMNGAELVRQTLDQYPDIAVLMITGYAGTAEDGLNIPRLAKPFGQAEVAAALDALVGAERKVIQFRSR